MLSGLTNFSKSLLNISPIFPPSAEELESAYKNVLFKKTVLFENYHSVNFDLTDAEQNQKYTELMKTLFHGIQKRTHQLILYDIQFLPSGLKNGPGHFVHIEWAEFKLNVEPVKPITLDGVKENE